MQSWELKSENYTMILSRLKEVLQIAVVVFGLAAFVYFAVQHEKQRPKPALTQERMLYLKDSLQMEYYRKELETTYPVDHSKIP